MNEQEKQNARPQFVFNFNAAVGQMVAHVDVMNVRFDKDMKMQVMKVENGELPEALKGEKAAGLLLALATNGLLGDDWQPVGLSDAEVGLLANALAQRLGINDVWKVFSELWHRKPERLRSGYNKGMEQRKSLAFQERLKQILR